MSVNKVILIGNVGRDPEVRHIDAGVAVANFSLATTERGYTSANGTVVPDRTEWHNIVMWRNLAEIAEKYVRKGSQVYIEGRIRTRSWVDKDNITRYTTEIYADNMQLLGARRSENQGDGNQFGNPAASNNNTQQSSPTTSGGNAPASNPFGDDEGGDDGLPF